MLGSRGLVDTVLCVIRINCHKYQTLQWRRRGSVRSVSNTEDDNVVAKIRIHLICAFFLFRISGFLNFRLNPIENAGLFANAHFLSLYIQYIYMYMCNEKLFLRQYNFIVRTAGRSVQQIPSDRDSISTLLVWRQFIGVMEHTTDAKDMDFFPHQWDVDEIKKK